MSSSPKTTSSTPTLTSKFNASRLLVATNRLPINVKQDEMGNFTTTPSAGGVTSGLKGMAKTTPFEWFGWPGYEIAEDRQDELRKQLKEKYQGVPVFLDDKLVDLYYNIFANSVLWPLLNYHPGEVFFSEEAWQAYQLANRKFAQAIAKEVQDGDMVWVHDYHLMLVPAMLREEVGPGIKFKIGFFIHSPWPSSEIWRVLPLRTQILKGLLHSDLIGFHTHDYARHFLTSCYIVLGVHTTTKTVTFQDKVVSVGAFPLGIDPDHFTDALKENVVQDRIAELESEFGDIKVMVGVDRLDYIKGLPQKLRAFEMFLETNPEWVGKVVLIQVAIPTRPDIESYQNLRSLVNELVGRINGKFGSYSYMPIHFMYQSVDHRELIALYAIADACVIASTRDGMNLVSFEYVACQEARHGSLILSEFAGSAQSLKGAIIINPWATNEMARAMLKAVTMDAVERDERWSRMAKTMKRDTSARWGETFIAELKRVGEGPKTDNNTSTFLQVSHDPHAKSIDWRNYDGASSAPS